MSMLLEEACLVAIPVQILQPVWWQTHLPTEFRFVSDSLLTRVRRGSITLHHSSQRFMYSVIGLECARKPGVPPFIKYLVHRSFHRSLCQAGHAQVEPTTQSCL